MKLPRYLALAVIFAVSQSPALAFISTGFVCPNGAIRGDVRQQGAERRMSILIMAQRAYQARTSPVLPASQQQSTPEYDLAERVRAATLKRVSNGGALSVAASFTGAAGAMAKYMDPDDVGNVVSGELPPIWVPIVVVGVLSVGIGLLQRSLGDVIDDEAKLGSISGARAAKQSARDRNMFKKK